MSTKGCPVFTFRLPGGVARPFSPIIYATGREAKIGHKLTWVCFQESYWKCLFCLMRKTLCWGYFAIGRTQLIEFWIWTGFGTFTLSDLDFEMKLSDWIRI